ncbi:MAG: DNA-3-methyladenine glycosylase family protein [Acidimicrobiia bacterium]
MSDLGPAEATALLSARDPVIGRLSLIHGPCEIGSGNPAGHFAGLARAVVFQQLNGRAAGSIYDRMVGITGDPLTPAGLLATGETALRSAGLSAAKAATLLGLAGKIELGELGLSELAQLSDEEVVERLAALRGIGRWTAEMFLIFELGRLDVWPIGDYGVRRGYALAYGHTEIPSPKELAVLGADFSPFRTVAAWYCWRAASAPPPVSG